MVGCVRIKKNQMTIIFWKVNVEFFCGHDDSIWLCQGQLNTEFIGKVKKLNNPTCTCAADWWHALRGQVQVPCPQMSFNSLAHHRLICFLHGQGIRMTLEIWNTSSNHSDDKAPIDYDHLRCYLLVPLSLKIISLENVIFRQLLFIIFSIPEW